MPQVRGLTVQVVQPMDLTGTTAGAGVQAREVDGATVQARAGHLLDSGGVTGLGMDQGPGRGRGLVTVMEVVALMVVATGLEVDKAIQVAVAMEEELVVQTSTTMVEGKSSLGL